MTKATIIFEDDGANELEVKIDFGAEEGINKDSIAHLAAAKAFIEITRYLKESNNEPSE